jgi:thiol-disulfide isomerase/thioredoxin
MSDVDDSVPPEPAVKRRRRPSLKVLSIAAVAGIAAGLAAVYVIGGFGSNEAAVASCEGSAPTAAALRPVARGEVAAFTPAVAPAYVGDLAFVRPDGTPGTMADFAGRTVLLNLWATWCAPCREEMPALDDLQAALGSPAFEVVAINVDTRDDGRDARFLEETDITHLARYVDRTMGVFNTLKGRALAVGMPTTLIIDGSGCQLGVLHGPAVWDSADAKALIARALDPSSEPEAAADGEAAGEKPAGH